MKSFEHGYFYEMPISHGLVSSIGLLGDFKGREGLYTQQYPEVLDTLRRAAMVQSVESSNRIEGITVADGRIDPLVLKHAKPRDRSEEEISGYRDALAKIHANPLGVLVAAYNDFAARVGTISSAKGAKRVLVKNAIVHLPPRFTIGELARVCKGISRRTLVRALYDLRSEGVLRCVGRGPSAQWEGLGR